MQSVTTIASAASREVLVRYQAAHVRRIRALLEARGAELDGEAFAEHIELYKAAGEELSELEKTQSLPFAQLCGALTLPPWLRDALVLIVAPHLEDGTRASIAHYWRRDPRNHVDAALVLSLLRPAPMDTVAGAASLREGGPLHGAGLVESVPLRLAHSSSRLEHELIPTPRLLRIFDGEMGLDPRFSTYTRLIQASEQSAIGVLPAGRVTEIAALVSAAHGSEERDGARLLLAGTPGAGKLRTAQALAAIMGRRNVLSVESAFLPHDPMRLVGLIRALAQEAEILNAQLVFRRIDTFVTDAAVGALVRHCLSTAGVNSWCTSDVDPSRMDAPYLAELGIIRLSIALPDIELRRQAWRSELVRFGVPVPEAEVITVGTEYPLSRTAIETAARVVQAHRSTAEPIGKVLARAAESQMRGQLARFAKRSRSSTRLDHLVLTENTREQVNELLTAIQRRTAVMDRWGLLDRHATGRGIVTLFNGMPGTGKTMCAAALANEIEQPLYRIDVSNLVDRFVGETEKNLVRMFDEAAASRAALLFDEADSLFSKRVEAKDSTDRYANMQVNLLLNLIEDYDGFVVLTTNLKGSLDDAFLRRIVYKIVFEMPEHDELVALWKYHLPATIPRDPTVDLEELADEFSSIAGGDIKNAVLRAALAAGGDKPITQAMLRRSMINELRANGGVVADRR